MWAGVLFYFMDGTNPATVCICAQPLAFYLGVAMVPSQSIFDAMVTLLAADATGLANTTANKLALVVSTFTPSRSLALANITLATFTGSTPLSVGTGTQQVFVDPISNLKLIQLKEPAGGFNWICTATPGTPETVYGWALLVNDLSAILGSGLLDTPIPISAAGQGVSIPYCRMAFSNSSPS